MASLTVIRRVDVGTVGVFARRRRAVVTHIAIAGVLGTVIEGRIGPVSRAVVAAIALSAGGDMATGIIRLRGTAVGVAIEVTAAAIRGRFGVIHTVGIVIWTAQ